MFLLASLMDIQEILTSVDQGSIRLLETVDCLLNFSSSRGLVGCSYLWPDLPLWKDPIKQVSSFSGLVVPLFLRGLLLTSSSQSDPLRDSKIILTVNHV